MEEMPDTVNSFDISSMLDKLDLVITYMMNRFRIIRDRNDLRTLHRLDCLDQCRQRLHGYGKQSGHA